MPEYGKYEKVPRPESIDKFIEYLTGNKAVAKLDRISNQVLLVSRTKLPPLKVFMTNIYIVGEADVYEITTSEQNLNAIVTMSAWNGYSQEAKTLCSTMKIGLFKFNEFLGAVYFDGKKFLGYISPNERERQKRRNSPL